MKRCSVCREHKPLEQFNLHPNATDGHQSVCKVCAVDEQRRRRAEQCSYDYTLCELMRRWRRGPTTEIR